MWVEKISFNISLLKGPRNIIVFPTDNTSFVRRENNFDIKKSTAVDKADLTFSFPCVMKHIFLNKRRVMKVILLPLILEIYGSFIRKKLLHKLRVFGGSNIYLLQDFNRKGIQLFQTGDSLCVLWCTLKKTSSNNKMKSVNTNFFKRHMSETE